MQYYSIRWGIFGAVMGGAIAAVGYMVLSPPVDSLLVFFLVRMGIGFLVAMFAAPRITSWKTRSRIYK